MMNTSIVYALDFDGVICDSAVETAITGWKAASQLWSGMPEEVPQELVGRFREVRPIIETGFEAILTMRMLFLGETVQSVYGGYSAKGKALMQQAAVTPDDLKKLFGETRDHWIDADLPGWIAMNPLFDGVAGKLQRLGQKTPWYVVTTKQERFVKQILKAHAVELADDRIFGLDRNLSKPDILKRLLKDHMGQSIVFVEDRLPTLINVLKDNELASVRLIFALWGYNTAADKLQAEQQAICRQELAEFLEG